MKPIKSLSICALLCGFIISFSSCGSDFLNAEQTDVQTKEQMKQGELVETARGFLSGGYYLLFNVYDIKMQEEHDDFSLRAIYLATDLMCEDVIVVPSASFFIYDYQNDNRLSIYRRTRSAWSQLYKIIYQTNLALSLFDSIEEKDLTPESKKCIGEALALRGYIYFVLINLYQQPYNINKEAPGIPIYTVSEKKQGRNTVAEVYGLILSDLTTAYRYLKETGDGKTDPNRISQYAAAGMLAKVLCFVNDYPDQWNEVAKYAGHAMQGGSLLDKAGMLKGFNSITLSEVLWGSSINEETNTYYGSFMSIIDPLSIGYASVGDFFYISSELHGKINPGDVRYKWFVSDKGKQNYEDNEMPVGTVLKFRDENNDLSSDYIYMRTAEMYYIKAEALYLSDDESGARSTLEEIMSTRLDGYSASTFSGEALLEEIRIQKRIDMWGDGVRLFDMKWRGEAMDRTGSTNHITQYTMKLPANSKEWVFQIPQTEMNANKQITENNP